MKSTKVITTLSLATLLSAAGCGLELSGPSVRGGSGSTGNPPAVISEGGATTQTIPLSIRGFVHSWDGGPLSGVKVCIHGAFSAGANWVGPVELTLSGPTSCATSATDGSFVVSGAPANTDFVPLTFEKEGFTPALRTVAIQTADITLPTEENALLANPPIFIGTPADPTRGQIAFFVKVAGAGPAPDVSVTATGFSNATALSGPSETPQYVDSNGAPADAGTAGGFVNVPSGAYQLTFHTSGACVADPYAYRDPASGSQGATPMDVAIWVPVVNGYVSAPVVAYCASR
jgi:hypothetical protein